MSSTLRWFVGVPKTNSASLFARSFSLYHACQYDKGRYAKWRLKHPEAYRRKLDYGIAYRNTLREENPELYDQQTAARYRAYYKKMRQDPDAWRKRIDQTIPHIERWRQDPDNRARIHAARDRFREARMEDERYKFYVRLKNWCYKYSWVREQLPWKSYQPVLYDNKVEHHCDGCNWTRLGGKKLWWKKIETSPAADSCSWLCFHCYVPKTNWAEALPQGYEDLGTTTIKEIIKRRDSLGHGG
ncbi:unnamed protein product [Aureobasidium mustum]|uniref:Uncharacterized protein n=1 Tax=Aureobasidium mustum TaxID=2773714 RepID=A0A9N8PLQ7_9PEZI|nr:unnamed protein product [Aureobasidium mustum]